MAPPVFSVVEQRLDAVRAVLGGAAVTARDRGLDAPPHRMRTLPCTQLKTPSQKVPGTARRTNRALRLFTYQRGLMAPSVGKRTAFRSTWAALNPSAI